ncbi:MAG: tetratricopeptide repeat protein [Flavobacteriales bacterium]|nr:tetratricopeptide repeat protein [Flavobacteriales bacterium]
MDSTKILTKTQMNLAFLTPLLLLLATSSLGQDEAEKLFQEALLKYERGNFYAAGAYFQEIVENFPTFELHDQCFYNAAYAYHEADSLELAIEWYERIRTSDLKDDDRVGGRGIFEPYANYKHYATTNIATIEFNRGNYEKALDYYRQSSSTYPYYNDSGTDLRINENRHAICITDCLENLGRFDEALMTILPPALDSQESVNYNAIAQRALELINKHFDKNEIKLDLNSALKTIEKLDESYSIWIRGKNVILYPYVFGDDSIEGFRKSIEDSSFWLELNKQ